MKIDVTATIINIDSDTRELKVHFDFENPYSDKPTYVKHIGIYKGEQLICKMYTTDKRKGITKWTYPSVPTNFQIEFSIEKDKLPLIKKDEEIIFRFAGNVYGNGNPGFGFWRYKQEYSKKEYRWLFDENGKQKSNMIISPFVNKQSIEINLDKEFHIVDSLFSLKDINGKPIRYKLKYKKNPTKRLKILLDKPLEKGEKLNLKFQLDSLWLFEETIARW